MSAKSLEEVIERIHQIEINESFDMIVAIANGGIIPAALLCQRLNLEINLLKLSLRDKYQQPMFDQPQLLEPIHFDFEGKRILLVEDRIKTGATINYARKLLSKAAVIKTFAVNGNADYCLYNESCFKFPWIL
ncbi:phosphoribosyltransferase [uncultured Bacteroides sp.]|uniref:phosphoribosyltransferase n=1 Tax=uncultured Bacteroides sp. TaxID=162156 RepID=UPI002AAACE7B|nr:phosphoribosyltransferase [uncultured Bacteroides sp.]